MRLKIALIICCAILIFLWIDAEREINIQDRHIYAQQAHIHYLENHVPTFIELQIAVGAEPDGIIGKDTLQKWERKICNQEAVKSIEHMAKGDKK